MTDDQDRKRVDRQQTRNLVQIGYDRMAEHYLASKPPLDREFEAMLERLLEGVPEDAPVLDLGCGAGVPVTQWLAARRRTIGVDLSLRQLELARQHVPGADLIQSDMTEIEFPVGSFGAVVAMYAIIHVPRENHRLLLERIYRWLRPGGRFLATWPLNEWEGEERDWWGWGAPMWWSHFGRDANLGMIEATCFTIELAQDRHGDESWCWVLARRPA